MPEPWYREFFRGDWQIWYPDVVPQFDTSAQVRFIGEALQLAAGERVLDTVCGRGRHAIPLAQQGYRVTGADLSELEIAAARAAAGEAGIAADFIVCDMRELPFESEFDAAYNVWTSFGFFEDPEDDRRALRAFRRALRRGGRFLIDYVNFIGVASRFQPRNWRRTADGTLLLEDHKWDLLEGAMRDTWTVQGPEAAPREHHLYIRMYTPYELRRELEGASLRVTKAFGGWDGGDLRVTSARIMLVAEAV